MEKKLIEIEKAKKIIFVGDTHGDLETNQKMIKNYLKERDIENFLKLEIAFFKRTNVASFPFFPMGLRNLAWQPEILSYEAPFGVGYLVADFKF